MSAKWLLPASLICGLIGGMLGNWMMPDRRNSATFETVRITKELFVVPGSTTDKGCRLSADGTVTATGGLIANQVRGNVIVGRSILASLNATQQSLENQEIAAEITANADRGGELILHNRDAVFCPAKGPVAKGHATFIGFDKNDNHAPAIYTQDIGQGVQGRAFVVCAKPKLSKSAQETAKHANPPQQQR
jgi:hypothetical protein